MNNEFSLIYEAYLRKQKPLEENLAELFKNDLIISKSLYMEWDMKSAFSGGLGKQLSNVATGAKNFLQDKVSKFIVTPLLKKFPDILKQFSQVKSKEDIGNILSRYKGEADRLVGGMSAQKLQNDSYNTFWNLVLLEKKEESKNSLKNKIIDLGNCLGDGGVEMIKDLIYGQVSMDDIRGEGNDNFKRFAKYIDKLVYDGDERLDAIGKLFIVLNGLGKILTPNDDEVDKLGPIVNAIINDEAFKSKSEESLIKMLLSSGDESEEDTEVIGKESRTSTDKAEEAKKAVTPETAPLKKVKTAIRTIASKAATGKRGRSAKKTQQQTQNALVKLYKGAGRISDIVAGNEEVAKKLAKSPEKIKVQQAQALSQSIKGDPKKAKLVDAIVSTAVEISSGQLPHPKPTKTKKKKQTKEDKSSEGGESKEITKSEKEFYQSVPEFFRILNYIARNYSFFFTAFQQTIKSVKPNLSLEYKDKKEETTKESETPKDPIQVLNNPNSDDTSIVNALKEISEKFKSKTDEDVLNFINRSVRLLNKSGEERFKTFFLEKLLTVGIDKKFHESIYNVIYNKSIYSKGKSDDKPKSASDVIEAEFTDKPDFKDGEKVDSEIESVSGKTPEQLKQEIIDLIRRNVPDEALHNDVLKAFQNSEERIKKAKDEEERKKNMEQLKSFLITKGFASEQNINHVMAAIAHMSLGGLVRPMEGEFPSSGASKSESLKERITKMGKNTLLKNLYDIIMDRSKITSLAAAMGVLFICFLLFGPAFLALLYVAAKAKTDEQNASNTPEAEAPTEKKESPAETAKSTPEATTATTTPEKKEEDKDAATTEKK